MVFWHPTGTVLRHHGVCKPHRTGADTPFRNGADTPYRRDRYKNMHSSRFNRKWKKGYCTRYVHSIILEPTIGPVYTHKTHTHTQNLKQQWSWEGGYMEGHTHAHTRTRTHTHAHAHTNTNTHTHIYLCDISFFTFYTQYNQITYNFLPSKSRGVQRNFLWGGR